MNNVRLIARLDIKGPNLIKGVHLEGLRVIGDPQVYARRYYEQGADELIYIDIVASLYGRSKLTEIVRRAAHDVFVPMTVGGGIRGVDDVRDLLRAGADKVAVNTAAVRRPELISDVSRRFGSQCVVVGIDSQTTAEGFRVYQFTGDPDRSHDTRRDTLAWAVEAQRRGAGELVLNCMASDGVRGGYDLPQLAAVRAVCQVPLVASGGAGAPEHFAAAFQQAGVDAALAASVFHSGQIAIPGLKQYLRAQGIEVRP